MNAPLSDKPARHILALSGGKDSSTLAVFISGTMTVKEK